MEGDPFARKRETMVRGQIEARGINDPSTLAAMRTVPRHEFVPPPVGHLAYEDYPLPIGLDQTISQPYIVAFMIEALMIGPGDRVLEIGTGSGYQAAVLGEITEEVFSIEILCELEERARRDLDRLGYQHVKTMCGDGYQGWPDHAPFDAIVVTASPDHVPQPLIDQLKVGGRLVIPVGSHTQELIRITRTADDVERERLLGVRFVPMTGEAEERFHRRE
jgi:protein-L-isoaspartate(D-aspartate) O-methyltransferase